MAKVEKPLVKEYATDEITVEWEPRLCFHSGNCSRLLPKVFDRDRRPWIKADEASANEIEATVAQCPSGALRARRINGAAKAEEPFEICASASGPLLVRGGVRIVDADGNLLYEGERAGPDRIVFTHTEIDESLEGSGFGSRLAAGALDDVRRQGLEVAPLCPFISAFIQRHPEYEDLVAARYRGRAAS